MKLFKFVVIFLLPYIIFTSIINNSQSIVKYTPFHQKVFKKDEFNMNPFDALSYSNSDKVLQTKIKFDIDIDIQNELIKGSARIFYKCLNNSNHLILDVKTLLIYKVLGKSGKELKFHFIRSMKTGRAIGRGLKIELEDSCVAGTNGFLDVQYSTTQKSIAVHFSHPTLLENRKYKFLYTHGPAIFARTFFPCQDTPSAKVILEAVIRINQPYTVLFSGDLIKKSELLNSKTAFHFKSKIPISTYLISISAGVLSSKKFGEMCLVYAEVPLINSTKLKNTFKDCSKYVEFYSKTFYKNPWGRMTFIILPDDFPYAGMENPYAIQISKSILTEDASFKNVVAHEIAHFWTGNLVTNFNWENFWINEGFTNYLYRNAFLKLYGKEAFLVELYKSQLRLRQFLDNEKDKDKDKKSQKEDKSHLSLSPKIGKFDPYSHFSLIPYEKGFSFLYFIELKIGEKNMIGLLKKYFQKFAFSTATTFDFVKLLKLHIHSIYNTRKANDLVNKLKLKKWLYGTEDIPVRFDISSKIIERYEKLLSTFIDSNLTLTQMLRVFKKLSTYYKNILLNKLSRSKKEMSNSAINKLKEFCNSYLSANTSKLEKSTIANLYLVRVKVEQDKLIKLKILLTSLRKVKFYHATYLKRIFAIFKKDLGLSKKKMIKILSNVGYRLNKLTVFRILQFILKK